MFISITLAATIALSVFAPVSAIAQDADIPPELQDQFDRFQLWNFCWPMPLSVFVNDAAPDPEEGKTRVETVVRSRLRAARIYLDWSEITSKDWSGQLWASVDAIGEDLRAYTVVVEFRRPLQHKGNPAISGSATTWSASSFGYLGSSYDFWDDMIQTVSEKTDKFIDEYLRVNAPGCP